MCLFCDLKNPPADTASSATAATSPRWQARRAFLLAAGAGAAGSALAQVDVGSSSGLRKLVPAETLETSARQQYTQVLADARAKGALAPDGHPQLQRLHTIAQKLIPHTAAWNSRSRDWKWQVNLIGSKQINAWCMPGGKIAFYTGILEQLKLNDDEVAMIDRSRAAVLASGCRATSLTGRATDEHSAGSHAQCASRWRCASLNERYNDDFQKRLF